MTQLIILRGNSGSGKTTLANALATILGPATLVLHQDVIRRQLLHANDHAGTPAVAVLGELLTTARAWSPVTILEGILRRDVYGAMLEQALSAYGAGGHSFYLEVPFAETLRRNLTKQQPFTSSQLRRWWQAADALPQDRIISAADFSATLATLKEAIA